MTDSPHIILAIESAISGGSISLLRADSEIANWTGTSNISKAEDLLANIDEMLTSNDIPRQEIGLIAVSAGPGSFTGIRIGIATALGLKTGLGIAMSSESALKAMVFSQPDNEKMIAAVPMGRNAVCLQTFRKSNGEVIAFDEPQTLHDEVFISQVQNETEALFVLHAAVYEMIEPAPNTIDLGSNIARAVGSICREADGVVTEPLFVSKSF